MMFSGALKENYLFRRLYRKGKSAANGHLVIYYRENGTDRNRIGLTVSGKLGHAVVRNLIRRRLRAIYRTHEEGFRRGVDLVVVARGRAVEAPYARLEKAYLSLAGTMGLYRGNEE